MDLEDFVQKYTLETASTFFLEQAFNDIRKAAYNETFQNVFVKNVKAAARNAGFDIPSSNRFLEIFLWFDDIKENNPDFARNIDKYRESRSGAPFSSFRIPLPKKHTIEAIEIVGHVINLAAFVELVMNKHLHSLLEAGYIENHHFDNLEKAGAISKILFAFEEDIHSKRLQVSRLKHLFRLRNKAVHYKASSTKTVRVTVEELIGIWREIGDLLVATADTQLQEQFNKVRNKLFAR